MAKSALRDGVADLGGNLDAGSSTGFGEGRLSDSDPLLGKLQHNGGFVPTHAPGAGSPAIGAVSGECPATDARGFLRSGVCDAGAHRVNGTPRQN